MSPENACILIENRDDLARAVAEQERLFLLFFASWCPFCTRFLPVYEQLAREKEGCFMIALDDAETMADRYAVEVYPTVLFIEKGVVSKRLDGVPGIGLDQGMLARFLASCAVS